MSHLTTFFPLADNPLHLALAMAAIIAAYAVFTLVGFGSALMASGPLAQVIPVGKIVPMLALLDCVGSTLRGWRARHEIATAELSRLLPGMLLGQLAGVLLLSSMSPSLMAIALGLFVVWQGAKGLVQRTTPPGSAPPRAMVHGMLGGVLGGLFGSGGFVYAAYLERRLASRAAFKATQAALIALSTAWRIILCTWVGLLDAQLVITALLFLPAMGVGVFIGHHIDLRMSREQLFRLLNGLLIASGMSLIVRFLG